MLLDEIGEMPAATQAKLLRVLEDRKLRRLGSKQETPVDVRVVAATNKDPEKAVAEGELRGDLYYRLNVFSIQMPPLREHLGDIGAIADRMISDMNERHGCAVTGLDAMLLERLRNYKWPGNVRELRNTIERAIIMAGRGRLGIEHLPPHFGSRALLRCRGGHARRWAVDTLPRLLPRPSARAWMRTRCGSRWERRSMRRNGS